MPSRLATHFVIPITTMIFLLSAFLVIARTACSADRDRWQERRLGSSEAATENARESTAPSEHMPSRRLVDRAPRVLVDVPTFAGKSASQVQRVLGPPTGTETIRNRGEAYPKKIYQDGQVEIVFVDGVADWITVNGLETVPFAPIALAHLGLTAAVPSVSNFDGIRWENTSGMKEVTVFAGNGGGVRYAYVCVNTTP